MTDAVIVDFVKTIIPIVVAIATGMWAAGRYVERIEKLEENELARNAFCEKQQHAIIKEVSERLCAGFKELLAESNLKATIALAEISKNIALITSDNARTRKDIEEIFTRLNKRRSSNQIDTGMRRRHDDTEVDA